MGLGFVGVDHGRSRDWRVGVGLLGGGASRGGVTRGGARLLPLLALIRSRGCTDSKPQARTNVDDGTMSIPQ